MENVKSAGNVKIPTVPNAASECHQAETAGASIVLTPAKSGRNVPNNGTPNPPNVPSTNTKRDKAVTRPCQQCGREMVVKRPSKRFCSAHCRRAAWLVRNPEKAAALAASDKARLRAHLEGKGIVWIEQTT